MPKKTNTNAELSQEMIDNIKHYGKEIKTLATFVEAVRQNPGYHLGSKGNKGLKNMAREIWQNSFDELDRPKSPCTWVSIGYDERNCSFWCEDNGRGIPFGDILRIFTNPNTSSNYTKEPYDYSSGLHGVGAKVVNAMSHRFIIESYLYTGEGRRVEFTEGYPWKKGEQPIKNPQKKQGTYIYFEPSIDALGPVDVSWKEVYKWLVNIFPLSKIGAKVYFTAIDKNGKEFKETLINEDGIMTYLINDVDSPLIAPIILSRDTGYKKLDIAFTWDASENATDHYMAFANKCPTIFGTHIDGFEAGVVQFFTNYMNKVYLAGNKKNKVTIIKNDVKTALKAIITVSHLNPIFDGQSKEKLSNEDMLPFVRDTMITLLDKWAKDNPKDLGIICKYLKDVADVRASADKQRIRLSDKYTKSKLTGLPAKYVAPKGKKNRELFITEGDSAAGLIKNHRINEIQGYFPIRGKLPNAFSTTKEKFLSNAEVAGIIQIIGGGYGRNFDISKVKWDKIIFCTDADPDGNHIKALLLRFFLLYMPQMIEAGKVYAALPPLYGIKVGKNKYIYLRDRLDYIKYIQKDFSKRNKVTTVDGKAITSRELSKILYNNLDYDVEVRKVANNHAIDPLLLESVLVLVYNKVTTPTKMKTALKKQFKFIESVSKKGDTIIIEGIVNSKYQTVFLNDMLIQESKKIFEYIDRAEALVYRLNDRIVSLYELMVEFNKTAPSNIQRFKGLGEMDGKRLFESTLNPEDRTLIQYTIDSVKEEIDTIKYYENDMSRLLQFSTKVSRFEVIE